LRVREENLCSSWEKKNFSLTLVMLSFSHENIHRENRYTYIVMHIGDVSLAACCLAKKIKTRKFSWHTKCQALTLNLKLVQRLNNCDCHDEGDRSAFTWNLIIFWRIYTRLYLNLDPKILKFVFIQALMTNFP
jgi:hypothetical protein